MYSYRHYGQNPMSSWGHAMFADDEDSVAGYYGKFAYRVDSDVLEDMGNLTSAIVAAIEEDYKNSSLPYDMEAAMEHGTTAEELADSFNPVDIVNSADGWDNADFLTWFYGRIAEPMGLAGVKTQDGAIVFDSDVIEPIENRYI